MTSTSTQPWPATWFSTGFGALRATNYALPVTERLVRSRSRLVSLAVASVLFVPLALRGVNAHRDVPAAGRNLYEQQFQMARFLNRFYSGAAVAANDIGAIDYYADVRCVDLYGLANQEVFEAKRAKTFSTETIRRVAETNQVRMAILYTANRQHLRSARRFFGAFG